MRRRRRRWDAVKLVRRGAVLLLMALFLASCVSGYRDLLELVAVYGENRCRNLVTQLVMDTVARQEDTEKLYCFTSAEKQQVISLDGVEIRRYQSEISRCLTTGLNALEEQAYLVPIGTVIGGVFLMGRGPMIEIRYLPVSSVRAEVRSRLQEAGVNQVLYQIVLELTIDMTVVLPNGNQPVNCNQTIVLEEVLVTGQVPYVYTG